MDTDGTDADGTITFNAYGPDDDDCSEAAVYTSVIDVQGDGDYVASDGDANGNDIPGEDADEFVPTAAGTYYWIASYSGDLPNTLGVSGECGDENESSLVITLQPTISTAQYVFPNDTASLSVATGGGDLAEPSRSVSTTPTIAPVRCCTRSPSRSPQTRG